MWSASGDMGADICVIRSHLWKDRGAGGAGIAGGENSIRVSVGSVDCAVGVSAWPMS